MTWETRKSLQFFQVSVRSNIKLSDHFCTLSWRLYSPRKKDFAADLYRLVLMTLTMSFRGVSDAGM